jgi:hypothetical protein
MEMAEVQHFNPTLSSNKFVLTRAMIHLPRSNLSVGLVPAPLTSLPGGGVGIAAGQSHDIDENISGTSFFNQ